VQIIFVVLLSSPFGDIICSSANLVLWSCGPLHLEIKHAQCKSCFVVMWSSRFGVIKSLSANIFERSMWSSLFGDMISSSANIFCCSAVLSIWRYNMLNCKSCFVVLRSYSFGDEICSSANLVLWSSGPLLLEIKYD
jgi:hypothetical protein